MRVLHVIPSIAKAHGGPSAVVALMAESLAARGVAVTIATTDDAGPGARMSAAEQHLQRARFAENGVELVFAPKRTEFYKVSPALALWLWRNICNFDVAHIHALFSFSSIAAGLIAALRGTPYILRPLGVLGRYGMTLRRPLIKSLSLAALEGPLLARAAVVQFTSESERREALGLGQPMRTVVLPLGARAPSAMDPSGLLGEICAPPDRPRVLFLSRIDPKKNLEGLLHALALLGADGAAIPFLLIAGDGDPGYVASLRRLATELGVDNSIAWLGRIDGPQKAAAWAAADIFVLASHSENFGIAAAEAMLAGVPSILGYGVALAEEAAAVGAARLTSTDPADIAVHLAELLDNPPMAAAMGERARAYAAEHFSIVAMTDRLEALYTAVLVSSERNLAAVPENLAHPCK